MKQYLKFVSAFAEAMEKEGYTLGHHGHTVDDGVYAWRIERDIEEKETVELLYDGSIDVYVCGTGKGCFDRLDAHYSSLAAYQRGEICWD